MADVTQLETTIAEELEALQTLKAELEQVENQLTEFGPDVDVSTLSPEDFKRWEELETKESQIMSQLAERQMKIVAMQRQVNDAKSGDGMKTYTEEVG